MLSRSCCSVVVFTTSLYWRRLCWSADGPKLEQPATRAPRRKAESIRMLRTVRFGMDFSHRLAQRRAGRGGSAGRAKPGRVERSVMGGRARPLACLSESRRSTRGKLPGIAPSVLYHLATITARKISGLFQRAGAEGRHVSWARVPITDRDNDRHAVAANGLRP